MAGSEAAVSAGEPRDEPRSLSSTLHKALQGRHTLVPILNVLKRICEQTVTLRGREHNLYFLSNTPRIFGSGPPAKRNQ